MVNVSAGVLAYDVISGTNQYNTTQEIKAQALAAAGGEPYIAKVQGELKAAGATPEVIAAQQAAKNPAAQPTAAKPVELKNIQKEATLGDQQYVAQQTGLPLATIQQNWTTGENYSSKLGPYSYTNLTNTAIAEAMVSGKSYIPGLGYNLTITKNTPSASTSNDVLSDWRTQTIKEKESQGLKFLYGYSDVKTGGEVLVFQQPGKMPGPAPEAKLDTSNFNNYYKGIDARVYAGGASVEDFQSKLENQMGLDVSVGNSTYQIRPLKSIVETSEGVSNYITQFRDSIAPGGLVESVVQGGLTVASGAAQLPKMIVRTPEYLTKTGLAGAGVGMYAAGEIYDVATGNIAKMPQAQAEQIGARGKGALTSYYSAATNPEFYEQIAGMVLVPAALKGGYEFVKGTTGVPEVVSVKVGEGSTYTGLFITRATESRPVIGIGEGRVQVGTPTFEGKPTEVIGSEIRTGPAATAIAEKAAFDYARQQGLPNEQVVYEGYRYAARETYPYLFDVKESLQSVISNAQPELGPTISEFIRTDKSVSGFGLSSEVKGSVAQRMQMGEAMGRQPQDVDIRTSQSPEAQAQKLFEQMKPEAERQGITLRIEGPLIERLNPETGQYYHIVQFLPAKGAVPTEGTGAFVEPEYIGFGLKEQAYMPTEGGVSILRLSEQAARKGSAAMIMQETGQFAPVDYRMKDIADATNIAQFVAAEKGRPDIAQAIDQSLGAMQPELRAQALKFQQGQGEQYAVVRPPSPGGVPEIVPGVRIPASEPSPASYRSPGYGGNYPSVGLGTLDYAYNPASYYAEPAMPSAGMVSGYESVPGLAPSSSLYAGNYRISPPGPSPSQAEGARSPSVDFPSPSRSFAALSPSPGLGNEDYTSPGMPNRPSTYLFGSRASPSPPASTNEPPPNIIRFPNAGKIFEAAREPMMERAESKAKPGMRGILSDLLSLQISVGRYGFGSTPSQVVAAKYEGNALGFVPTAEMVSRGVAKEKYPRAPRQLIPEFLRGGKK